MTEPTCERCFQRKRLPASPLSLLAPSRLANSVQRTANTNTTRDRPLRRAAADKRRRDAAVRVPGRRAPRRDDRLRRARSMPPDGRRAAKKRPCSACGLRLRPRRQRGGLRRRSRPQKVASGRSRRRDARTGDARAPRHREVGRESAGCVLLSNLLRLLIYYSMSFRARFTPMEEGGRWPGRVDLLPASCRWCCKVAWATGARNWSGEAAGCSHRRKARRQVPWARPRERTPLSFRLVSGSYSRASGPLYVHTGWVRHQD